MKKKRPPKATSLAITTLICLTVVILAVLYLIYDNRFTNGTVNCGDAEGPRPKVDIRNFQTDYTQRSYSISAELKGQFSFKTTIDPKLLQTLSESIQSGMEYRKAIVAGYNACGIKRGDYQVAINHFQVLDELSRQIQSLMRKPTLTSGERTAFLQLIEQYEQQVNGLVAVSR